MVSKLMKIRISLKNLIIIFVLAITLFVFIKYIFKNKDTTSNVPPQTAPSVSEISVTARQFSFSPNNIKVSYGERVRLRIKSVDVTHGISLPDFNVNAVLQPNNEVVLDFVANKRGTFSFFCNIACGEGHLGMRGLLTVE